jgi:hypothetical protein
VLKPLEKRVLLCHQVKNHARHAFPDKWLKEFKEEEEVAFFYVCKRYPGTADSNSRLLQGFRGPFKVETFKFHEASNSHKKCCDTDLATNHPENTPPAVCQRKMDSKMYEHLKCLFNIAYYIAKFNKPLTDFKN